MNKYFFGVLILMTAILSSCSKEKVIGLRQNIHHDDFDYSVLNVEKTGRIGEKKANGIFYIITFKVQNNAKRVNHEWLNNIAFIVDERNLQYENNNEIQKELNKTTPFNYQEKYITPAGKSEATMFVYDVPRNIEEPYLKVRGDFLMGDLFDGNQFKKTKIKLF